jgi:hypothetical protein
MRTTKEARYILLETGKVTLLNEQRRLYGNLTDWLPDDPVIIKRMAILKERQAMKDRRLQPVGRSDPNAIAWTQALR